MVKNKLLLSQQNDTDYIQYNMPSEVNVITSDMRKENPFGEPMKYIFSLANGMNVPGYNPYVIMETIAADKKSMNKVSNSYVLSLQDMEDMITALNRMIDQYKTEVSYNENMKKTLEEFIQKDIEYRNGDTDIECILHFHQIQQLDSGSNYRLVSITREYDGKFVDTITLHMYLTGMVSVDMENIQRTLQLSGNYTIDYDEILKRAGVAYYKSAQQDAINSTKERMKRGDNLHFVPNRRK